MIVTPTSARERGRRERCWREPLSGSASAADDGSAAAGQKVWRVYAALKSSGAD